MVQKQPNETKTKSAAQLQVKIRWILWNVFVSNLQGTRQHSIPHPTPTLQLAIHLSFLTFRCVRALFRELLREIANQSLYTSHNIADFVHLWFCEKLDEKLSVSPLWHFMKILTVWRERRNAKWEKWLTRWFTKCHLYTYRFSHFATFFHILVNLTISV